MGQTLQEVETTGKLVLVSIVTEQVPEDPAKPRKSRLSVESRAGLLVALQSHPEVIRVQGPASLASRGPLV